MWEARHGSAAAPFLASLRAPDASADAVRVSRAAHRCEVLTAPAHTTQRGAGASLHSLLELLTGGTAPRAAHVPRLTRRAPGAYDVPVRWRSSCDAVLVRCAAALRTRTRTRPTYVCRPAVGV